MKQISLLLLTSLIVQASDYSGTIDAINFIYNPPAEIQGVICERFKNDGDEHSAAVCRDGVSAAEWMSKKYASKVGKYLGCIDGFYQGVWDGYLTTKNPSPEVTKAADEYVAGAEYVSAKERGSQRALDNAVVESANDIIKRYRRVIELKDRGQQVLPNKDPDLSKIPKFWGFDDGYEQLIASGKTELGTFDKVISLGHVTASSTLEDKIAAQKAYLLQGERAQDLCDVNQTIFGRRDFPQLTIWDYFKAQRQYDFENYGWDNGAWAWDVYINDERTVAQYQNYENLGMLEKNYIVKDPITETRVKRDAQGNIVIKEGTVDEPELEEVIVDYKVYTERKKIGASEIKAYQEIYRVAFVEAYSRHYARANVSLSYHDTGLLSYELAKSIGKRLGEAVASQIAKKDAYDKQYKLVSQKAYDQQAEKLYLDRFYELIGVFESNPVIELNSARVIGEKDDAIFTAGEGLYTSFSVTNLGEVSAPINFVLANSGGVATDFSGYSFSPAALSRASYTSGVIGSVANSAKIDQTVNVKMTVQNPSDLNEISDELTVSLSQGLVVRDYAEISGIDPTVSVFDGTIDVKVDIENPSSIETPAFPSVKVVLNNIPGLENEKALIKISPFSTSTPLISFSGLDPLKLAELGTIRGTVYVSLGSGNNARLVDQKDFSISVGEEREGFYARYFDKLITGKTKNTGGTPLNERIGEVIGRIDNAVDQTLATQKIKWKKQYHVNKTVVASLQSRYRASAAAQEITSDVQQQYDRLANLLAQKVRNKGKTRIRGRDKHYLKALSVFSPDLSLKKKDHK